MIFINLCVLLLLQFFEINADLRSATPIRIRKNTFGFVVVYRTVEFVNIFDKTPKISHKSGNFEIVIYGGLGPKKSNHVENTIFYHRVLCKNDDFVVCWQFYLIHVKHPPAIDPVDCIYVKIKTVFQDYNFFYVPCLQKNNITVQVSEFKTDYHLSFDFIFEEPFDFFIFEHGSDLIAGMKFEKNKVRISKDDREAVISTLFFCLTERNGDIYDICDANKAFVTSGFEIRVLDDCLIEIIKEKLNEAKFSTIFDGECCRSTDENKSNGCTIA